MKVWIIFNEEIDGPSAEAFEIRRFIAEAKDMDIEVSVYRPRQFDLLVTEKERDSVLIDGHSVPLPDFILPRTYVIDNGYFPLAVLRQLERLGVEVFNDSACIEMVADKLHTHQVLVENNLPTPDTMLAKFPVDMDLIADKIGFPVVVKTLLGVNGTGVFLMEDRKHFQDLMDMIQEVTPNVLLIFQKFIAKSHGRDLRLFVVEGEVVAAMERRARADSFKANISQGGTGFQIDPDETAKAIAIKTAEVLGIRIAGIDLLYDDNGYTVCEANTFPGFKGLETYCDVNIPRIIFGAMQKRLSAKKDAA